MDNIIVGLVVAGAVAYLVRKFVKMWKGEGGCNCSGACGGCAGNDGSCGQDNMFFK